MKDTPVFFPTAELTQCLIKGERLSEITEITVIIIIIYIIIIITLYIVNNSILITITILKNSDSVLENKKIIIVVMING